MKLSQIQNTKRFPILFYVDDDNQRKKKPRFKQKLKEEEEKYILCLQCENKITRPRHKIQVQGEFSHTFLNPAGQVFRIGCFEVADGCMVLGEPTFEWTWFQGFQWQVALCGQCLKHLGWFYRSEKGQCFFGLILDTLI